MLVESIKLADRQRQPNVAVFGERDFQYLRVATQIGSEIRPRYAMETARDGRRLAVPRHEGKSQTAQGDKLETVRKIGPLTVSLIPSGRTDPMSR